ncbi:hypothetical protein HZH68_003940 [Vespula germanica]|uniref:Uncharacterized protein n=1 Tax=Vespula germanica TaxID=30212 RepID=A0A836UZC5_VESGE|nr:hypothetical protein HZH68_003940 [Vespula germanica]
MGGMGLGVLSVRLAQCQLPDSENGVSACDVIGVDLSEYFNEIRGRNSAKLNRETNLVLASLASDNYSQRIRNTTMNSAQISTQLDAQDVEHKLLQVLATTSKHPSPALMRNRIRYL